MQKPKIMAVAGSTASGKSALAVSLCEKLCGELICCDSMHIYKRMDIGTAKPTADEKERVRHRMVDVVEPENDFSCADYVKLAKIEVADVIAGGRLPVFCGGTGLYLDAFLRGSEFSETKVDTSLRRELEALAEREGNEALHAKLREIDSESADAIHPNNVKRVIRAIEIYRTGGITKSELDRRSQECESEYDALVIALKYNDRALLYDRIDKRVDMMIADGLVEETRMLCDEGIFEKNTTASQAIGYKEMLGFIKGEMSLAEATELLKGATRRYAKRQMTWFSQKSYVRWIDADRDGRMRDFEEILEDALALAKEHGIGKD